MTSPSPESFDDNREGKDERQHWLFEHGDRGGARQRRFDWLFTTEEGLFIETFSALSMTGGRSKLHALYNEGKGKLLHWLLRHGDGGGGFGLLEAPLNEGENGKKLLNVVKGGRYSSRKEQCLIFLYINAITVVPYEYQTQLTEIPSHFTSLNAVRGQANKPAGTRKTRDHLDKIDKSDSHYEDKQDELVGCELKHIDYSDRKMLLSHAGENGGGG
jgi:hypothetical protein